MVGVMVEAIIEDAVAVMEAREDATAVVVAAMMGDAVDNRWHCWPSVSIDCHARLVAVSTLHHGIRSLP